MKTRAACLASVLSLAFIGCDSQNPLELVATTTGHRYSNRNFTFIYLPEWRVEEEVQLERFFHVKLSGPSPRGDVRDIISVMYRTAPDKLVSDATDIAYQFGKFYCGQRALPRTKIAPQSNTARHLVLSFVVRGFDRPELECLESTVFTPPRVDNLVDEYLRTRPHVSSQMAQILYAHESEHPRAQSNLSEIGGGDVDTYLRAQHAWNLIVESFRFKS